MTTDTTPAAQAPDATPAPAPAGEEGELLALHARDPQTFEYSKWGDTDRTGAERLLDIRKAQEAAKAEQEAEGDDIADEDVSAIDLDAVDTADEVGDVPEAPAPDLQWDREDFGYTPPEGTEVTELGQQRIDAFADFAHQNNLAPESFEGAVNWYNDLVRQEQSKLAEADKVAVRSAVEALGGRDAYAPLVGTAKSVLKTWPKELRDAVRDARTSDGRRVALMPEFVQLLAGMGEQRQGTPPPRDSTTAMQQELRDLDHLMRTNIDDYHREWRGLNMTASDRRLELMRQLGDEGPRRPSASDIETEKRELIRLRTSDPQMFSFGNWRGSGRPASDRLVAIQTGRG